MSLVDVELEPLREFRPHADRARRLHAVDRSAPRRRPRLAYALTAVGGAGVIVAAQLGLSILTAQSTYELASVQHEHQQLTLDRQELADEVTGMSSPQYLAANAAALGMVIDSTPSYLRLSDASIIGAGEAASSVSTVNVAGGNAAANALIADEPLVTDRDATIGDMAPSADVPDAVTQAPPLEGGLPTPNTH